MRDTSAPEENVALDRLASGEPTPERLQVAIVVALLEAAHASGGVQSEEITRVSSRIFSLFGLSDAETGHLIEVAEIMRMDKARREKALSDIRANFELSQRQEILSIVWRILIIDREVNTNEANIAVEIRKALGLSMEAAVAARIRAEATELGLLVKSFDSREPEGSEEE